MHQHYGKLHSYFLRNALISSLHHTNIYFLRISSGWSQIISISFDLTHYIECLWNVISAFLHNGLSTTEETGLGVAIPNIYTFRRNDLWVKYNQGFPTPRHIYSQVREIS